ncbi:copper resistance system multicopper oxidase [Sphingomonas sp. KRR8]|uniref:copper resistance system multicopper oxidase n=1 Tax=Sphingomonas sp. KRR8 TaxID=2942996 RepID=UPI00202228E1|nr:copper resistance system multicopper oxidase [Sphingomonas sp. KRR8]URD61124.1 copper resistance system multicopper oxidase [Sphingomonas sp. KRR8]
MFEKLVLERRQFLRAAAIGGTGASVAAAFPAWAQNVSPGLARPLPTVSGNDIALTIGRVAVKVDGKVSRAVGINGTVPAPLVRLKEGQRVRLRVQNTLDEDSSIHWHGLLVPFQMDGVPGVSFPGIMPHSTFDYEFEVGQSGTYWYHSHSAYQEEDGLYGPIVIDPAGPDPVAYDREHVLVLSDHTPLSGATIFKKLKQMGGGYFNMQRLTLSGALAGRDMPAGERREWAKMRMDPADIADVTGSTYTYTVNGVGPFDNWTGLFKTGERVRLRIINAAAQTNFNVRIPDLPMTVVAADGQNVRPVTVDEFQIGVAETFDVIVTPGDRAYSFVSESIDRSGLGRATLAPRTGMSAPVPPLRPRPLLAMKDMGMDMGSMGGSGEMSGMDHGAIAMDGPGTPNVAVTRGVDPSAEQNASRNLWKLTGWKEPTDHGTVKAAAGTAVAMAGMSGMDHAAMGHGSPSSAASPMTGMDHAAMGHAAPPAAASQPAAPMAGMDHGAMGHGSSAASAPQGGTMAGMDHGSMSMRDFRNAPQVAKNPGVQTISPMPTDRTGEPPQGLEGMDHRVLTYRDLMALSPNPDVRAPSRKLDIHLTGNMERYMWSFDGVKLSDPAEPIPFRENERVRVTLINDTMMPHPIHLHGHFFELVTGHGANAPRKHTVNVPPGGKMTFDLTADAVGDWAFHCHNLYHMTAGMMRVVTVRKG